MYASFFGLERLPFDGSPDPYFLFASPAHREAMAAIACGIEMGKGLTLVTGEVGLGKTTLLRAYLAGIDRARFDVLYLFHPRITFDEMLELIAAEIGVPPSAGLATRLQRVQERLVQRYVDARRRLVVVIDEAQRLSGDTLEGLRLLSNLESDDEKLLQIVLVGQPEIDATLSEPGMRQLNQRIALRARLAPLTRAESVAYIHHRLRRAGAADPDQVLAPAAVRALVDYAAGVPRAINIAADNALINAFGTDERPVSAALMRSVIAEQVDLGASAHAGWRRPNAYRAAATLVAAAALSAMLVSATEQPSVAPEPASQDWARRAAARAPERPILVVTLPRRPALLQEAPTSAAIVKPEDMP